MSVLDEIVSQYGRPDTVEVKVGRQKFVFRCPKTAADMMRTEKHVRLLARAIMRRRATPDILKAAGEDPMESVVVLACWISELSVEPKISIAEALGIANHTGGFFVALGARLMEQIGMVIEEAAEEEVEEEGEDLNAAAGF